MKIIGHRGARGLAPENTISSFKKALRYSVDEIELDVRVTKDRLAIVHHDKVLRDPSGTRFNISESDYKELKRHKPDLLKFSEALDFINGKVPIYVEVKWGVEVGPILKELEKYHHDYRLASKSQKTLKQLHDALPQIPKIVIEPWSGIRARMRAKEVGTKTIAMNKNFLWFGFVSSVARSGYELYAYPLNDPVKAKNWQKRGLAGVVTDYPDRF